MGNANRWTAIKYSCSIPWNAHAITVFSSTCIKSVLKNLFGAHSTPSPDQLWDLAADIRVTALLCSPSHCLTLQQNPPRSTRGATERHCSLLNPGNCQDRAAFLNVAFIFTNFFSSFSELPVVFSFQLSFLGLQFFTVVEERAWKLGALDSPCGASVWPAIYSLSLTELQKCWEFCNYILGTESWSVYCQTKLKWISETSASSRVYMKINKG